MPFFLWAFLLTPIFFSPAAQARFCWDLEKTGCTLTNTEQQASYYYLLDETDIRDKKANNGGKRHKFRMRPECDEDDDDCEKDQNFTLTLSSYVYQGSRSTPPTLGDKKDSDIELHLHGGDTDQTHDWEVGQTLKGKLKKDKGLYTKDAYFKLEFNKDFIDKLGIGFHRFIFYIEADSGDGKKQTLKYVFGLGVQRQVKISGLQNVSFGKFPYHSSKVSQNFCVHATGNGNGQGGSFKIYGASNNAGIFGEFYLEHDSSKVYYSSRVGQGADSTSLLKFNNETFGQFFTGSATEDCNGQPNMTLEIELDTSFEVLSRLPAGSYTDTLWLTVEAE